MTYDPQIPLVTESPLTSASPVQVNFDQFAKVFSQLVGGVFYNHFPLNNSQQGKHGSIIMQNQVNDPGVDENQTALFSKNGISHASTEPQLFLQIPKFLPTNLDPTNAPNASMKLTYNSVNTSGPIYYSFLTGGYIFYFGKVTGAASSPHTITLSPIPTTLFLAIANSNTVEPNSNHRALKISANITSPSTFDVYCSFAPLSTFDFTWMAIAQS
jgi:hypothetical protein